MAFDVSQTRILMLGRLYPRGSYPLQFRKTSLNNSVSQKQFRNSLKWLEEIKVIVHKWIQLRIFKYVSIQICFKLFKTIKSLSLFLSIHLGIYPFCHFSNIRTRLGWETLAPVCPFLIIKVWKVSEDVINRLFLSKNLSNLLSSLLPLDCHTCLTCISPL